MPPKFGSDELWEATMKKVREHRGPEAKLGVGNMAELSPVLDRMKDELLWGVLWSDPCVDLKTRCLCTISVLAVSGLEEQLKNHMAWALNSGVTKEQIVSILAQMTIYGGLARGHNSMRVAKELFVEKGLM